MITVDIVCPTGGLRGGIENVIKEWTRNLDHTKFDLRIVHMEPGISYLEGYPKSYFITTKAGDHPLEHLVAGYEFMLQKIGEPDICIATNWPLMTLACWIVRQRIAGKMKIVSWVHNRIEEYEEAGFGGVKEMLYADVHFAINERIEKQITMCDSKAVVYRIGNPIHPLDHSLYQPKKNVMAFVGRLDYVKRVDLILEAVYRAKGNWKLKIIGDGEIRSEIEGWIELLKLQQQVELLGWKEEPWIYCRDAAIMVMASEYEGFSMTAIEASSMGMTVISTPVDGIVDYIVPGINGYFFEHDRADLLAQVFDYIEEGILPICDQQRCRESVSKYTCEKYFEEIERILCAI